jgi:hypothetical protein
MKSVLDALKTGKAEEPNYLDKFAVLNWRHGPFWAQTITLVNSADNL